MDDDAAYLALTSRDARFDGGLFVGVTSTGIYCRPVCRVRTPKRANCRFFSSAAQAEAQSFRPCLKCRPEIAPGAAIEWSVMDASRTLACQAADALAAQAATGNAPDLASLASRIGISDRHLRRIFNAEHGVTPLQFVQTRRLLLAKQLLTDSMLPVAQVALASGFRSLRRFNAAFADNYRMTPGRLRRQAVAASPAVATATATATATSTARATATATTTAAAAAVPATTATADAVAVTLAFRPPYDTARLLRFFAQRAIPGIEQVDAAIGGGGGVTGAAAGVAASAPAIRRSVRAGVVSATPGWVEVRFARPGAVGARAEQVLLRFSAAWAADSGAVIAAVRRWLDLDASPWAIDKALSPPASSLDGASTSGARPACTPIPVAVAASQQASATRADAPAAAPARGRTPDAPPLGLPGDAGLRLPGSLDAFELCVRAVLGQQVTVAGARTLARRLVERFGDALPPGSASPWPELTLCFPQPATLATTPLERIAELGIIRNRAAAIIALARAWPTLAPLMSARQPAHRLVASLCALPGIGPWTAHYIAMRALSWPDAFPPNDVALLKAMRRLMSAGSVAHDTSPTARAPLRQREADAIAEAWRPWRSYAVLRLWNSLEIIP